MLYHFRKFDAELIMFTDHIDIWKPLGTHAGRTGS
jgi:hypothetical protein